jgi:hypothetical protein
VNELQESRQTVANLQGALDVAHSRIRELESALTTINGRYIEAAQRADQAEGRLFADRAKQALQNGLQATQMLADVPT